VGVLQFAAPNELPLGINKYLALAVLHDGSARFQVLQNPAV